MYIRVRVLAKAKKESFEKISEDTFCVSVKEPAKQNLANTRVCEIVADYFSVPPTQVRIISGHHSPGKLLSVSEKK